MNKVHFSSQISTWETPWYIIRWLEHLNGAPFALDAAASAENKKAKRCLTEKGDALKPSREWLAAAKGGNIWLNPPYGRNIDKWVLRAYEESANGAKVTCLLPARTDTSWFHDICLEGHVILCRSRIKFDLPGAPSDSKPVGAPFPSMVVRFGFEIQRVDFADLRAIRKEFG